MAGIICGMVMATAFGQGPRPAHIGYVYPAGGRQGTTVEVLVGGQAIANVDDVVVSGEGIKVRIVKVFPPTRPLDQTQRIELIEKLWDLRQKRLAELPNGDEIFEQLREMGRQGGLIPPRILQQMNARAAKASAANPTAANNKANARAAGKQQTPQANPAQAEGQRRGFGRFMRGRQNQPPQARRQQPAQPAATPKQTNAQNAPEGEGLPEHPLLMNLESKSLRQLQEVADEFLVQPRRQPNIQLNETVLLEITIDPNAIPGDRQIRLSSPTGLTNPLAFQVSMWPEVREQEPNDPGEYTMLPPEPAVSVPFILNGQIKPGDVDRFKFFVQKGQKLVIQAHARDLMPYLADAVPGWFQATLALYDSQGREVAYADDYEFNPDPVLFYKIPADGEYELEIRDSIYRGREDFVYRVSVGEQPFITSMFPLGGKQGANTIAEVTGWNLPDNKVRLNTQYSGLHPAVLRNKAGRSNQVAYQVDDAAECVEKEPNDSLPKAQAVSLPAMVNGRIGKIGDIDYFRIGGRAGEQIVAEVFGRRLESPIDSIVRLMDLNVNVIAWNDDHADKSQGLKTHFADSYLTAKLPETGEYILQVSDAQRHGGSEYGYRLRIEPPRPDFQVRITPSSFNLTPNRPVIVTAYAMRQDGFDGDIEIALKNAPAGYYVSGGRIPKGKDSIRMTLSGPAKAQPDPVNLELEARALVNGQAVTRAAVPADDMEQAFAYHHLVTTSDMIATVRGGVRAPMRIEAPANVTRIRAGGTAQFRLFLPPWLVQQGIELELNQPPDGIKLVGANMIGKGEMLATIKADPSKAGLADNLIFEVFTQVAPRQAAQKPGAKAAAKPAAATATPPPTANAPKQASQKRRVSAGVLPAVAVEVVK